MKLKGTNRLIIRAAVLGVGFQVLPTGPLHSQENESVQLEETTLRAQQAPGNPLATEDVTTVMKSESPLFTTPRSVNVVTREIIEEQNATDLHDVFRNVPGLNQQNFNGDFNIRGFRANGGQDNASILYNGLRGHPGDFTYRPSLANVEQVQVLKGPSSMLHGTLNPGGVINIISKKAQKEPIYDFDAEIGSFDRRGVGADIGGALTEDGTFQYRLTADYLEHESHKDFIDVEQAVVQPAVAWEPTDQTRLDLIFLYTERDAFGERRRGTPDLNGDFFALPDNFTYNEPDDINDVEIFSVEALFDHEFSEDFRFSGGLRYFEDENRQEYHEPRGAVFPTLPSVGDPAQGTEPTFANPVVNRSFRDQLREAESIQFQGHFAKDFETGPLAHTLTLGGDWSELEKDFFSRRVRNEFNSSGEITDINVPLLNVLDPVHPGRNLDDSAFNTVGDSTTERTLYGLFAKDRITFGARDQWHVQGGVRYDHFEDEAVDHLNDTRTSDSDSDVNFSGGILYELREDTSLYASYSESFVPQDIGDQTEPGTGGPFDPEEAWQIEAGIKKKWLNGRFQTNATAFFIEKENLLVSDPTDPGGDRLLSLGAVESEGIEIEAFGQLTDHLSLTFNYSLQNIEITETSPAETLREGDPPERGTPEQSGSFWLRYHVPNTGFKVAFGPNWVDERPNPGRSGPNDDETIPSFVVWDAMVEYAHASGWKARLKVNNAFDKDHFSAGGFGDRWGFQRGAPINAVANVSFSF